MEQLSLSFDTAPASFNRHGQRIVDVQCRGCGREYARRASGIKHWSGLCRSCGHRKPSKYPDGPPPRQRGDTLVTCKDCGFEWRKRKDQLADWSGRCRSCAIGAACVARAKKRLSARDRFMAKVSIQEGGCWNWTGSLTPLGYGYFYASAGRSRQAHRFLYEERHGPVPAELELDHLCRNPRCVNPDHLEAVSHLTNMQRSARAQQTHCHKGHPFTEENTYVPPGRYQRMCRLCNLERQRRRDATKRKLPAQDD